MTEISPGEIATDFMDGITDEEARTAVTNQWGAIAIPPDAIGRGVLFALEQPPIVEVGSIVICPTAQS